MLIHINAFERQRIKKSSGGKKTKGPLDLATVNFNKKDIK